MGARRPRPDRQATRARPRRRALRRGARGARAPERDGGPQAACYHHLVRDKGHETEQTLSVALPRPAGRVPVSPEGPHRRTQVAFVCAGGEDPVRHFALPAPKDPGGSTSRRIRGPAHRLRARITTLKVRPMVPYRASASRSIWTPLAAVAAGLDRRSLRRVIYAVRGPLPIPAGARLRRRGRDGGAARGECRLLSQLVTGPRLRSSPHRWAGAWATTAHTPHGREACSL